MRAARCWYSVAETGAEFVRPIARHKGSVQLKLTTTTFLP